MSKGYKITMFILLGVGAIMLISSIGLIADGDLGAGIFGVVFSLALALPMLILCFPLKKKREAAARRAAEQKAADEEAARQEAQQKREEWNRTHIRIDVDVDEPIEKALKKHAAKADDILSNVTVLQPYEKDGALRYAVIMDDEKVGDIVNDAPDLREYVDDWKAASITPSFDKVFSAEDGDMHTACSISILFEAVK